MTLREIETYSFVLRIWFEPIDRIESTGEWRGHVTDVVTLERRYFRRLENLYQLISECIDASENSTETPESAEGGRLRDSQQTTG